jgi:hypothetical protein
MKREEDEPFFLFFFKYIFYFFSLSIECFLAFFSSNFILQYFVDFELVVIVYFDLFSIRLLQSQTNIMIFSLCLSL